MGQPIRGSQVRVGQDSRVDPMTHGSGCHPLLAGTPLVPGLPHHSGQVLAWVSLAVADPRLQVGVVPLQEVLELHRVVERGHQHGAPLAPVGVVPVVEHDVPALIVVVGIDLGHTRTLPTGHGVASSRRALGAGVAQLTTRRAGRAGASPTGVGVSVGRWVRVAWTSVQTCPMAMPNTPCPPRTRSMTCWSVVHS